MNPRCQECGFINSPDSPYCVSCRTRLGQERERAVKCGECGRETWERARVCVECSEHADEVGARLAEFDAWTREHRDMVEAVELG